MHVQQGMRESRAASRLLRAGQSALRRRMYADSPPWHLTSFIEEDLDFIDLALGLDFRRVIDVFPKRRPPLVVASDARDDESAPPSRH